MRTKQLQSVSTVWVRRQWDDWRKALVPLRSLRNVAWSEVSGGVKAPTPRPFLHGYIYCNEIISGDLAHSCLHGPGPHSIKVRGPAEADVEPDFVLLIVREMLEGDVVEAMVDRAWRDRDGMEED